MLLPTAPFRALQPGECTRVMAPLGSTIVVDRRKLQALGVPEVSLPITAWMLLFWKAAAAGWRCYSAGQEQSLETQPDFPSEETAFLLRVLRQPGLRALGPREPLVSRGNIAFSLGHGRAGKAPGRGRPRVLIISPFLPYPLSHGGAVRIYNLTRALAERVDFALVSVRENQEAVDYAGSCTRCSARSALSISIRCRARSGSFPKRRGRCSARPAGGDRRALR